MKLKEFLKCKHDLEINSAMTRLYCVNCGQDSNVITHVHKLRSLLIQARPWINLTDDLPDVEEWAKYDNWKKQYGELMGNEQE